ncbi:MAG: phenylalanyl-tRNA synthetase beta chain, partial [Bradymonadia bacterium]
MNVSWNWLQDFIDLSGLTPQEVAHKLTMSGMEVEQVEAVGGLDNVVVGRIVDRTEHPESDHLSICTVDGGDEEMLQIVCGAPNAAAGMSVPLAKIGARLGEDFVIKKAKMRGVASFGMLCSSTEIGLDDGVDGLMKLDDSLVPGTPIGDALGLADTVFEIGLTPNRPDGLSIRGVAREIAALYDRPWGEVEATALAARETCGTIGDAVQLEVKDSNGCPRYCCVAVKGVKIGPSPEWMQQRLKAVGQRPVNNIVDVTNYILLEQGQPLHSFDLARVRGGQIVVRRAAVGETIESIDHVEHTLVE